jgi:DNA-binding LytR/AlgR family response regulator
MKCLIVDDEPIARKIIAEYLENIEGAEITDQVANPLKAAASLANHPADLVFLDIEMPRISGIDFLRTSSTLPMVILTTAYPQYAIEGFELSVIDYLLKPIGYPRFLKAYEKAHLLWHNKQPETLPGDDFFFVKCNNHYEKIFYADLLFAEAANNYVILQTAEKRFITYLTFKSIEEKLSPADFIRVHKSFIVSRSQIKSINAEELKIASFTIPISRNYKDAVLEQVVGDRVVRR